MQRLNLSYLLRTVARARAVARTTALGTTALWTTALWITALWIGWASLARAEADTLPLPVEQIGAKIPSSIPWSSPFSFLDLESSGRFNYVDRLGGGVIDRGIQYRLRMKSRLNLLGGDTTYILTRAETGGGFSNSWNETPADLNPGQTIFNLKSIALVQELGPHAEVAAGGIEFEYGEGSDETYVSHDGYMTGYRARFTQAASWLPKKLAVTAAFVGDFDKPNIFSRFRMDRENYIQVLAQQDLTPSLGGSAEFDEIRDALYNRDALRYRHAGPLDEVVTEVVFRTSDRFTFGWSSELRKNWGPDWKTELIYSDLPTRMYLVNGSQVLQNRGEIGLGKRLAWGVSRQLTRDCTAGVFAGRLLDRTAGQQWVAQAGVSYQFASLLNHFLRSSGEMR